jgi:L-asparagine transporter-like permease
MFFKEDTRIALYIAPIWFAAVIASYYMNGLNKQDHKELDFMKK